MNWMSMLIARVRHRHDWTLRIEPGRMFLACTSCLAESPGWALLAITANATSQIGETINDRQQNEGRRRCG